MNDIGFQVENIVQQRPIYRLISSWTNFLLAAFKKFLRCLSLRRNLVKTSGKFLQTAGLHGGGFRILYIPQFSFHYCKQNQKFMLLRHVVSKHWIFNHSSDVISASEQGWR